MDRLGVCADCDSTRYIDTHGNCKTCNSSSTMVIGNDRAKNLRSMRNKGAQKRGNLLLPVFSSTKKSISKVC